MVGGYSFMPYNNSLSNMVYNFLCVFILRYNKRVFKNSLINVLDFSEKSKGTSEGFPGTSYGTWILGSSEH